MDEFDEDEDFVVPMPSVRARPIYFLIAVLDAIESLFGDFNRILMRHSNWQADRQQFMREASADIERLVSGE